MASSHQKGNSPHFFKIILHGTLQSGKLGIPKTFVRKYGNGISSPAFLRVPTGAVWKVELIKSDGKIWLQNGWQQFSDHYSLELGHLLVFGYEGKSNFNVMIFDKSTSEIEYPYTRDNNGLFEELLQQQNIEESEDDDDDDDMSVEQCDGVSGCRKSKEKSHLPCPRPTKKMRTDSPNQTGTGLKSDVLPSRISPADHKSTTTKPGNLEKVEKSSCSRKELDGISGRRSVATEVLSCAQIGLTDTERAHALQIASSFKSTGNPVFMVVMRPSFLYHRYKLGIPSNFAKKFFTMKNGNLTLCDSTGKTWPAEYYCAVESKKSDAYLLGGWRAFAKDNNLNVSDVCVFELVKYPEILLKVVIYRSSNVENTSKAWRPPDNGSTANQVKARSSIGDRCPSCSRGFKEPKIEENEDSNPDIEILDGFPINQRTKKEFPSAFFEPFKMMRTNPSGNNEAKGIKLEKQKKSLNEHGGESSYLGKDNTGKMQPLTRTEKLRACIQASGFRSANPSFTVLMQPSYVCYHGGPLNIPEKFAKRYLQESCKVTLRISDGRTWIVEYRRKESLGRIRGTFGWNGWRAFVLDNNLKDGDICFFELNKNKVKENGTLLEVAIFPAPGIASCSSSKLGD
ncbi:hypothetical protein PTKIN_Ptkin07bG0281900 [Pterospermum kingtungense]